MNWKFAVFDAYGTLFDVHASSRKFAEDIGENYSEISEIWRQKQLEYTWTLTLMGEYKSFWELTQEALEFALEKVENTVTRRNKRENAQSILGTRMLSQKCQKCCKNSKAKIRKLLYSQMDQTIC